jgi:23S rRNA (uridine2552-2'-O)-methyltransferase
MNEEPKRRMIKAPKPPKEGGRGVGHASLKQAYKHSASSQKWLERQLNDPYVTRAKQEGWRSRAAFKLIEIDDRFGLIKPERAIVDLGCAPGGWLQVIEKRGAKTIVGMDLLPIEPMPRVHFLQGDFTDADAVSKVTHALGTRPHVVLSDLAHNTVGHKETDHLKIINLIEYAMEFALTSLLPGGHFVAKAFQGGATTNLLSHLQREFDIVKHMKPKSSRSDSSEVYIIAMGRKKK